jgi:hypothetical protein
VETTLGAMEILPVNQWPFVLLKKVDNQKYAADASQPATTTWLGIGAYPLSAIARKESGTFIKCLAQTN